MSKLEEIRKRIAKIKEDEKLHPEKKKKWIYMNHKTRNYNHPDPWDIPGDRG